MKEGITRRTFIKGTAVGVGAAAVSGSGLLRESVAGAKSAAEEKNYSFEVPPPPIPDSEIKETITSEIVVIGAGTAGLVCANSAVENGASVVLIASSSKPVSRGGSNHAFNTKVTRRHGISNDLRKDFKSSMISHSYRISQDKWWLWANKSGEAMDWVIDKMEEAGYETVLERTYVDQEGILGTIIGAHSFLGGEYTSAGSGQQLLVDLLAEKARKAGVQIYYKTTAMQLIRENNNTGRVSAVIARTPDGGYTRYVGTKAVVLATGDFTKDEEMVEKYCPLALPFVRMGQGVYNGSGHKMGLWVGAAWQKTVPNAPMILSVVGPGPGGDVQAHPGLVVNKNGIRFGSEDNIFSYAGIMQMQQPDMMAFGIWDSAYAEQAAPWFLKGDIYPGPAHPVEEIVEGWESSVKSGIMMKADTIDAIAEKLDIPAEALKATVERYNGFCKTGVDEEYNKRPGLLIPVDRPPFYAMGGKPLLLIVCGGLRTNIKMQVLDKDDRVIPGLYAVGTIVGDMYSNWYDFVHPGHNLGATCITFGYLVGRDIANS